MEPRIFDLNVEEVLQDWEVRHAVREVIANAIDEQLLTNTAEIAISKDRTGTWHVRDFGRGIRIEHFTLNEDVEKLGSSLPLIGKFGVGLKDALATFHRRGVDVIIRSSHGTFTLKEASKHGFDEIITLHVQYDSAHTDITGTDFLLRGVDDAEMAAAKALFLKFSGADLLESTRYGDILTRTSRTAIVYIRGVLANEEENFLFSYNITDLTDSMKKRLNRERLNVGRTTYTDRVKAILTEAVSDHVKSELIAQVRRRGFGDQRDELSWIDVSQHAMNLMAETAQVAYVTEEELQTQGDLVGTAKRDGIEVVVVSETQKAKAIAQALQGGRELRTLGVFAREFNESFKFEFIAPNQLTSSERQVFNMTDQLLALIGLSSRGRFDVRISGTMRITATDTEGVWDPSLGAIVIKRSCLSDLQSYAGTLLHEAAHATTGFPDSSRQFEGVLTKYIGMIAELALQK